MDNELAKIESQLILDKTYNNYCNFSGKLENRKDRNLPLKKIAFLRAFTIEPLLPVVRSELNLSGLDASFYLSDLNTIQSEVLNDDSEYYKFVADFTIVALWPSQLNSTFFERFLSYKNYEQREETFSSILKYIFSIVSAIRKNTSTPILLNNLPSVGRSTFGILDSQSLFLEKSYLDRINHEMVKDKDQFENVFIVDFEKIFSRIGSDNAYDSKMWHMAQAPLDRKALIAIGQEYVEYIKALTGLNKKCLVLDCDNTLWGGIIGEDGLDGIKLGTTYPGSCYQSFHKEILNFHDKGIILAICSKNNVDDVKEVFNNHEGMILKEEHIANFKINWTDKPTNIKAIASELNIGLDSLVFVDDSSFECALVRDALPQVTVIQLPKSCSDIAGTVTASGAFNSLSYSNEDRKKNLMYRAESTRKQIYQEMDSHEDFLISLDLVADINVASVNEILRISQLTQKTNQFNLTTKRYSKDDISKMVNSETYDVFYLKLKDKVSNLGLVSVAIIEYIDATARIDSFLMSCRSLGRGVEKAFLSYIMHYLQNDKGISEVIGYYIPTKKNQQVEEFYKNNNFELSNEKEIIIDPQGWTKWEVNLNKVYFDCPSWVTVNKKGL